MGRLPEAKRVITVVPNSTVMPETGDPAPDFTAPLADGDIQPFTLSDHLDEGPFVLAFFPGAFTDVCRNEMRRFQADLESFEAAGVRILGISVDTPFALNKFREENALTYGLISDMEREIIDAYDVRTDFANLGVHGLAQRAVFIVNRDGRIAYSWETDDPGREPDYEEIKVAARAAVPATDR